MHEPGDDRFGYEKASERWLPVHTVETILISVISMLADPNDESPANVDAAVSNKIYKCLEDLFVFNFYEYYILQKEWRQNYQNFKRRVAQCVRKSQEMD